LTAREASRLNCQVSIVDLSSATGFVCDHVFRAVVMNASCVLLRARGAAAFDVREAARLELDCWQARREAVGPRTYGLTVAEVAALTYGKRRHESALRQSKISKTTPCKVAGSHWQSGIARAESMAWRDARGLTMAEQDWVEIERRLLHAGGLVKAAVTKRQPCAGAPAQKSPGRSRGF
jgi:hypothetical protein